MPAKTIRAPLTAALLAVVLSGCSSIVARFDNDTEKRGNEYDYFSTSYKPSRYYIGTRSSVSGNSPFSPGPGYYYKPSDRDITVIFMIIPATLSLIPKALVGVDIATSAVADTLLLPMDFILETGSERISPQAPAQA